MGRAGFRSTAVRPVVNRHFIKGGVIAFDTETTGLSPWHGDMPFAFAFYNTMGESAYFELEVDPYTRRVDTDSPAARGVIQQLRDFLEDERVTKVLHNAKFDIRMMEQAMGIEVAGPGGKLRAGGRFHDTMFMAHICNSDEIDFGLKELSEKYIGIDRSDQKGLKKVVAKLRRRAKKLGWNIAYDIKPKPTGDELKPATAADYWIPRVMWNRHPELATEDEANLCRTYALMDVERTMILYLFYSRMIEEYGQQHIYQKEIDLWSVNYLMEERGVRIDPEKNQEEIAECLRKRQLYYKEIEEQSWPGINVNSHHQLRVLLYDKLGLPVVDERRTDTGLPGTSVDALDDFKEVPVVRSITKFRAAEKAYAYFAKYKQYALPDRVVPGLLLLHADFRQMGPGTARYSCANPNLQQVTSIESSRSADPIDCRGPFGPRSGFLWLHIDYVGMEVRVFADCAQEPHMLAAIREGREIHDEVCNRGWGGPYNEAGISETIHVLGLDGSEHGTDPNVQKVLREWWAIDWNRGDYRKLTPQDQRRIACEYLEHYNWDIVKSQKAMDKKVTKNKGKMVTFAKIYGGSARAVKDLLHVTLEEAALFMWQYDQAFPRVAEYMNELTRQAELDGYVINRWGRRLVVPPMRPYAAVNYMVQGSSADFLKSGMIRTHHWLRNESGVDGHLIMTIHDELVFEIRREHFSRRVVKNLQRIMEDSEGHLNVPMPTDPSVVVSKWSEKHKINMN